MRGVAHKSTIKPMRSAYRILAHVIAGLVVVQAAAIAFAFFGLLNWVGDGHHNLTPTMVNDQSADFTGSLGFEIHSWGANLIALGALVLLIMSFFAKVPGGVKWAAILFGIVVLQWALAFIAFGAPVVGLLHGANALAVIGIAELAASKARGTQVSTPEAVAVA